MSKNSLKLVPSDARGLKVIAKSATKAEISIYDSIGQDWFGNGITAASVKKEIDALDKTVNEIVVRINSPGGDVFDGVTIYNILKQQKAKVTVQIDGLAASIASIIALSGSEIVMGEGALFMVHLPWTSLAGNRNDLDKTIETLMTIEEQMISIYSKRTKMSRAEIKQMLEDETWLDAEQAIAKGFVDKKSDGESLPIAASAIGSKWFSKKPTAYKSEESVIAAGITDLKNKIKEKLARK